MAGQRLHFEGDVLEDMRRVGAAIEPLKETAPLADAAAVLDEPRKQGHQAIIKTWNLLGAGIFQIAEVHPGFKHLVVGPDVGAA